jgi:signal peptidase I
MATVVTGAVLAGRAFYFLPSAASGCGIARSKSTHERRAELDKMGMRQDDGDTEQGPCTTADATLVAGLDGRAVPGHHCRCFCCARSCSSRSRSHPGSMIPTLLVGDLILVNKFHYGLRLPVINTKMTEGTPVQRGDVMVFRYPPKPSLDYIKRVVGCPATRWPT